MTTLPKVKETHDVPSQIFQQFLQALEGASMPPELIALLRKTLLEDKIFTERASVGRMARGKAE
jgi:hypothetical protein